jgi:hypothetical protein
MPASLPPSIGTVAPVMKEAASLQSQATVSATSSERPTRPIGRRHGPEPPDPRRPKVWIGGYGPPQPSVKYAPKANPLSGGVPVLE